MNHKNSGLTLVETLVSVAILSILALSVYIVFKSGIDAWSKSEERLDIYQNARVVLDQISREVVGAFVDTGTGARLEGEANTLTFVTDFSGAIYKISYYLDTSNSPNNILKRDYIDYSLSTSEPYTSTAYTSTDFISWTKGTRVDNIEFFYLRPMAIMEMVDMSSDWAGASVSWSDAASLPEAIRMRLTFRDANDKAYLFETIVYLPNSEE